MGIIDLLKERTVISMKMPTPRRGGFFRALHACALEDGMLSRVIDAYGIGPAMGINDERDLAQFELLARSALYNLVAGATAGTVTKEAKQRAIRLRILDPSAPLSRREVDAAMSALSTAGIACVLHARSDKARRVHGALNVWRSCSKQDDAHSPPCTPPTCWPSSEEEEEEPDAGKTKKTVTTGVVDDEEWADDTYGCMPWGSDGGASEEYDNVSHTASSTVVRLPRSLLAPFASALMDELDKLGVECARERLAEAHKKAKRADDEIQSLHDVSARLGDSVTSLRSGNHCRIKAIKELKGVQERLEADIKRLNVKTADAYATLIVAREDAAKAGNEMTVGMSLMRAESTALQSEVVALVARKASHAAALQLARSEAEALEEELRSAKEVADGRKCVARAALRDLEADRAASAADLDRAHALTQAAVLQAVDARVVHMDALDEAMRLREEAERAREEGERLREEAVALDKQNALLLGAAAAAKKDAGLLQADGERLQGGTGLLQAEVERLQADAESLARRRDALQAESADTRTRIDELLHERHRQSVACGKVMGDVEELTVRHRVAVRARLGAGAVCRAAAAHANAAMREIASLESLATANRHRAAAARDAAVEAESASFRAKVQRDLASPA